MKYAKRYERCLRSIQNNSQKICNNPVAYKIINILYAIEDISLAEMQMEALK